MKKKVYKLEYGGKSRPYARSVVVGNMVYLSGMSGKTYETGEVSSLDIEKQVEVCFDKIKSALEEAGTSMEHIIKNTIYFRDVALHYDKVRAKEKEYYEKHCPSLIDNPPCSTVLQVVSLARPEMLLEIDIVAYIPD